MPSNEGRGYVLRKIIRRALRHANLLQSSSSALATVLPSMADAVKLEMGAAYPELEEHFDRVRQILLSEEQRFSRTITVGLKKFAEVRRQRRERWSAILDKSGEPASLPGEKAFLLYDTYGLAARLHRRRCP